MPIQAKDMLWLCCALVQAMRSQTVMTHLDGCALWRSWQLCCPTASYILGATCVAVLCRPNKLRNGPGCSRQAVVSTTQ